MAPFFSVSRLFSGRTAVQKNRRHRLSPGRLNSRYLASLECLENRSMLSVTVVAVPGIYGGDTLKIDYGAIANQSVVIEIEEDSLGMKLVHVYVGANTPLAPISQTFFGVDQIEVNHAWTPATPIYDSVGVNNNSLTIKAIYAPSDRLVVSGGGRTVAGRYEDGSSNAIPIPPGPNHQQIPFEIAGIDDLTFIAGGTINVSGSFTNDTNDASIRAVGGYRENTDVPAPAWITGAVVVADTTLVNAGELPNLPHRGLFSNFIEITASDIAIRGPIEATDRILLRVPESASIANRKSLVLPYDITVTGSLTGDGVPVGGQLDLVSTASIVQLESSTIVVAHLSAMSFIANPPMAADGPWMIDLGSVNNDFDTIRLGMTSVPGNPTNPSPVAYTGRIGIRDIDDLTVSDFGILASTSNIIIRTGNLLTLAAAVHATGFTAQSDFAITSTAASLLDIGDEGITLDVDNSATNSSSSLSPGDILLNGRIQVGSNDFTKAANVSLRARGTTTIHGGIRSLHSGTLLIDSDEGILIDSAIEVGSTERALVGGTTGNIYAGHVTLISHAPVDGSTNGIVVNNAAPSQGLVNSAIIQATDTISLDSTGDVLIAGRVLAGTLFGTSILTGLLSSISVKSTASVEIGLTGSLQTTANGTDWRSGTINALVGRIQIEDASKFTQHGSIVADGVYNIIVPGDVELTGSTRAREDVNIQSTTGSISVQGSVRSLGGTYAATAPATPTANITLTAVSGLISTGDNGTLTAGTVVVGPVTTFGDVILTAQQDISVYAAINTPGPITVSSTLGAFDLSALLKTVNGNSVTVSTGNGMIESDLNLGRIVTDSLVLINTGAGGVSSIDLQAKNNQVKQIDAKNFSVGGDIRIANNLAINIVSLIAERDPITPSTVSFALTKGITQSGPIQANSLVIVNSSLDPIILPNILNNVDNLAVTTVGTLSYTDANDFETGGVLPRSGTPVIEVTASFISLTSIDSTIRVVSGLSFGTLSLKAAGTVEFVTTTGTDSPPTVFIGSLRNMITYANANTAPLQSMRMVFDETGYLVNEIVVAAALPAFSKPVEFAGYRLESSATAVRLGIRGAANIATGLLFATGSSGSSIIATAVYGFTNGSAISLSSSNNTVINTYAGVQADGTTVSANFVGLDLSGVNARTNHIGSNVFDVATANRFSANTSAGILVRAQAANNRILGNFVWANGDGIRFDAAGGGNLIGSLSEVDTNLLPAVSNWIVGNKRSGIAIINTIATASATNRVRNNEIDGNGTGITINKSSFASIGAVAARAGNTIIRQANDGIALTESTDVQIMGNRIGIDAAAVTRSMGNTRNGIAIATSKRVAITGDNRISANKGNGISIATNSTAVTISGNTIGGLLDNGLSAGNQLDGVVISASIGNTVGTGNLISYNKQNGVRVIDSRGTTANGNKIFGSEIAKNSMNGVLIAGGAGTTIGGTTGGTQNKITANKGDGIRLEKTTQTGAATNHLIQGNFIGTNENRDVDPLLRNAKNGITIALGTLNTVSNSNVVMNNLGSGIVIEGGTDNTVGGILASAGNVIANNTANGISIKQSGSSASTGHRIYGNTIVENAGNGIEVNGVKISKIFVGQDTTGKVVAGRGNTIADNTGAGVKIIAAKQVAVQGNTMGNNGSHIELDPNANPGCGVVTLTSATLRQPAGGGGNQVEIVGTIAGGKPNQVYLVDFYANDPGDDAGIRRFIGRATTTADGNGNASIKMTITSDVLLDSMITATATSLRYDIGQTTGTRPGDVESRVYVRLR